MQKLVACCMLALWAAVPAATAEEQKSSSVLSGVTTKSPGELTPEGRLAVGRGGDYVNSSEDEAALAKRLRTSMQTRREFAWKVVEQMLRPLKVKKAEGEEHYDVPLWQTWYEGMGASDGPSELKPIFELYFDKLALNPTGDRKQLIKEALDQYHTKNFLNTLTNQNFEKILLQHKDSNLPAEFGGRGFTLFSPSFVEHLMEAAQGVEECSATQYPADRDPPDATNFSHCIKEFPRSAVMVKSSWSELTPKGVPVHDTSAAGVAATIREGTWPGPSHPTKEGKLVPADETSIYTNVSTTGKKFGLNAIHFSTKDVREWVWVSLWWDPNAKDDFGADRPAFLDKYNDGVWKNYKMCVATAFAEEDTQPWKSYTGPTKSLGDSIQSTYEALQKQIDEGAKEIAGVDPADWGDLGPWPAPYNKLTSWCSNPNLESHVGNGRTSCIGCHQLSFTTAPGSSDLVFIEAATHGLTPQFGRAESRKNFPADFAWSFFMEFKPTIIDARKRANFEWPPTPTPGP